MTNGNSKRKNNSVLDEYRTVNELLYHVQTLQMQSLSIVLSGVLVLVGLSLTMVGTQLFLVFFPFVITISFVASFVIGLWFRYSAEVLNVIFDHKAELEESLGFKMEKLIQKKVYEKPRGFLKIAISRRSASRGPLWISFSLSAILIIMYFVIRGIKVKKCCW